MAADAYEQWMNDMSCEDRWCVKCGAWYAGADPNDRICEECPVCPDGECHERAEDYCDHEWQEGETPGQIILRQRLAASRETQAEGEPDGR